MIGHSMSENDLNSIEANENVINEHVQKQNPIKRVGCSLLLVLWFTLLLSPCALFYLAANGEIRVWHADIPEAHAHPRLLIELVSEVDYRGLQFTRSFEVNSSELDDLSCVQTDVSYFLWESVEDNQDVSYCDCYIKDDTESKWQLNETYAEPCSSR
jgi:hypothetical protein